MKTNNLFILFTLALWTNTIYAQNKIENSYFKSFLQSNSSIHMQNIETRGSSWLLDSIICITQTNNTGWVPENNYYYLYNDKNLLVKDSTIEWHKTNTTIPFWQPAFLSLYYYNDQNQGFLSYNLVWYPNDKEWRKDTIRNHNYYNNGKLILVSREIYNPDIHKWNFTSMDSLFYNSENQLIQKKIYVNLDNEIKQLARYYYTYENSKLVSELLQITIDGGGKWSNYLRNFYHYDNELLIEKITDYYNEKTFNFEPTDREVFNYNINNLLASKEVYSWDGDDWILYRLCDLYYSEKGTTSVNPIKIKGDTIKMSNPFQSGTVEAPFLDNNTEYILTVYNASNQLVYREKQTGNVWYIPAMNSTGIHVLIVNKSDITLAVKQFIRVK